jgi:hypothetical protein
MDQLVEMFHGTTVDGRTSYVPGQSDQTVNDTTVDEHEDDIDVLTPKNSTSGTKRPSSNTDTASSPPKKNKNAMVRCMKGLLDRLDSGTSKDVDTATQIQEIIENKRKEQQAADFKEIDLCLALAKECGATEETDEFFVASQLFASCKFQRHVFLGLSSNAGRMAWLKKHCKGWTF